jgi:uridine phosphorylase
MSFPNFPEKYHSESVLHPEDVLAMRRRSGKFPKIAPPEGLILCLKHDLPSRLRWRIPVQKVGRVMGDLYLVRSTRGRVGLLSNFGIGAPVLVSLAEEMIAWGVRRFIVLSWGGALQEDLNSGDVVVVDKAIRDEGVSHHYLPSEKYAYSDSPLMASLVSTLSKRKVPFRNGSAWTTDAPYRETKAEVFQYRSEGVQVVEMETAGLFALAKARQVAAASIVIAADNLADGAWKHPSNLQSIDRSFEVCYSAAIQTLNEDA